MIRYNHCSKMLNRKQPMRVKGFSEPTDIEKMIDGWCHQAVEKDCRTWNEISAFIDGQMASLPTDQRKSVEAILEIMLAARTHGIPPRLH